MSGPPAGCVGRTMDMLLCALLAVLVQVEEEPETAPPIVVIGRLIDDGVPVVPLDAIGSRDVFGPEQVRETGARDLNDLVQNLPAISTRPYNGWEAAAPSFSMRQFEIAPGGHTPKHSHAYEHEVFILEGSGVVLEENVEHPLRSGTAVYVPPNQLHQFRNTGTTAMKFLCLIPQPLRGMDGPCAAACNCD